MTDIPDRSDGGYFRGPASRQPAVVQPVHNGGSTSRNNNSQRHDRANGRRGEGLTNQERKNGSKGDYRGRHKHDSLAEGHREETK
jgi:hypothetical protein